MGFQGPYTGHINFSEPLFHAEVACNGLKVLQREAAATHTASDPLLTQVRQHGGGLLGVDVQTQLRAGLRGREEDVRAARESSKNKLARAAPPSPRPGRRF